MNTKLSTNRKVELDALRVLACLLVVVIHVSFEGWHNNSTRGTTWHIVNFFNGLSRGAVPVFVMLSGVHFLKKDIPLPLLFKKYILRLFVIYVIWAILYAFDSVDLVALSSSEGWKSVVYYTLKNKYHLWYLPNTIGAYLSLPLLWALVRYKEGKYIKYILFLFVITITALELLEFVPKSDLILPTARGFIPNITSFPCLILAGYYFYECKPIRRSNKFWIPVLLAFALLGIFVRGYISYMDNAPNEKWLSTFSLPNVAIGFCLFQIFINLRSSKIITKFSGLWSSLSACTLGIYLLHVFVMEKLLFRFNFGIAFAPVYISIPIVSIVVFAICWAIVALLRRIPVIGKWIV